MPDLDKRLRSCLNLQPSPILELQAISIGHGNRLRKIEKDIFALIRRQTNAPAMARVKIERERSTAFSFGQCPAAPMNGSRVHRHIST